MWCSRSFLRPILAGRTASSAVNALHKHSVEHVRDRYHYKPQRSISCLSCFFRKYLNKSGSPCRKEASATPPTPGASSIGHVEGTGEGDLGLKRHEVLTQPVHSWNSEVTFERPLKTRELRRAVRVAFDEMMRSIDKLRNNGRLSSECLVPVAMAAYVLTSQPSTVIFSSSIERVLPIRPEGSYYVPDGHEKLKCILAIVGESRVKEIPGPSPEQHMEQHTACVCAEIGAIDATFKMHTDFTQASLEGTIVTYGYPNRDEGTRPRFMDSCGNRGCPLRWGCHQLLEECRITAIKPGKMATRSSLPEIVQIKQADQGEGVLKPDAKKGSWF